MNSLYKNSSNKQALFKTILICALLIVGCKKQIQVDLPVDKITGSAVYNSAPTAIAAMTGIYAEMRNSNGIQVYGTPETIECSKLSDELQLPDLRYDGFYINDVMVWQSFIWDFAYRKFLYRINAIIEGVSSGDIPDQPKQILLGEAKFIRAYIYFQLLNYYGDVPLVLTTDFNLNSNISRSSKDLVYDQIVEDLKYAQNYLTNDFLNSSLSSSTIERVRPNKFAATALLARVYLYRKEWQMAELESSKVISDDRFELVPDLNSVFIKNSREAIWQMQPDIMSDGNTNTPDGRHFIPIPETIPNYTISSFLGSAFEMDDLRRTSWLATVSYAGSDYLIPYKYKIGNQTGISQMQTEYMMVLRLAEQYLIRAEARANQGKLVGANSAENDLNAIRNRAGLANTLATNQEQMLEAIANERRVELFTEGSHRWFDLKRTGKIDEVMSVVTPIKGGEWTPDRALLPIPASEFQNNPALRGHQNPGYPEN